jgi:hypothetical protein
MSSFFVLTLLLKLSPLALLLLKVSCKISLSDSERGLRPSSESSTKASSLPVKHGLSEESSPLILFVDDVIPFIEASSSLLIVHSNNKVTHDSVCLLLHLRDKMLLLTLILLNLDSEFSDRVLMPSLSSVKLSDIFLIFGLSVQSAGFLPDAESFI